MSPAQDNSTLSDLKWTVPDNALARECFKWTNWEAICDTASRAYGGQPCRVLPNYTCGGSSLARLLEFQDGTRWVARIQLQKSDSEASRKLRVEIDTTILLRVRTKAPVPQIFAFNVDDTQSPSAAYMLLEFFPGNTAMDEARGYARTDWGLIPCHYRRTFYRSMAAAHVRLTLVVCLCRISHSH